MLCFFIARKHIWSLHSKFSSDFFVYNFCSFDAPSKCRPVRPPRYATDFPQKSEARHLPSQQIWPCLDLTSLPTTFDQTVLCNRSGCKNLEWRTREKNCSLRRTPLASEHAAKLLLPAGEKKTRRVFLAFYDHFYGSRCGSTVRPAAKSHRPMLLLADTQCRAKVINTKHLINTVSARVG